MKSNFQGIYNELTQPLQPHYKQDKIPKKNHNTNSLSYSGNSDVDINLVIDTTAMAYVMACFLHTTGQIDDKSFEDLLINLKNFSRKDNNALPELLSNQFKSSSNKKE